MGGTPGVDGKDLVRRYLEDVFSGGNLGAMDDYLRGDSFISIRVLDGDRFVDGFFEEDEVGLLEQLGALSGAGHVSKGRHSPLAPSRRAGD